MRYLPFTTLLYSYNQIREPQGQDVQSPGCQLLVRFQR